MDRRKWIAAVLLLYCLLPCCRPGGPAATVSFYHWKQVLALEPGIRNFLERARVGRLFIRFFDVDLDAGGRAVPVSELEYRGGLPGDVRVIPVVFLAERVFRSACDPARLAGQVAGKIRQIAARCGFARPREIQVDCDWTEGSRTRFFAFLEAMRGCCPAGTALSATLRLHQVKFRDREGVPPVDRATLMLYNMGRVESPAAGNSIIDAGIFRAYAGGLAGYPLRFDLALPIYRWGLVYRLDRLARILNDLGADEVAAAGDAMQSLGDGRWLCRRETHLGGAAIFPGDLLRLEAADFAVVRDCLHLAREELGRRPLGLVFYHLDAASLARFGAGRILDLARESSG
jgi:hypothetical protein